MTKRWMITSGILAILTFQAGSVGCNRGGPEEKNAADAGNALKTIEQMHTRDAIVSINGKVLTRARFDQMLDNNKRSFLESKANKLPRSALPQYLKKRRKELVEEYVNRQLLISEAEKRGVTVSEELKKEADEYFRQQAEMEGKTLQQWVKAQGDTDADYALRIHEWGLIKELINDEFGDALSVTEEDLQNKKEAYRRYAVRCEATNKLAVARGHQIVSELRAGADFTEMAEKYSESTEDTEGYWGEFTRYEIDDANVRHAAFTLPVGSVSEPFDTEKGLMIIKVLERSGVDAVVAVEEVSVKLGRIFLRMLMEMPCPSDDELRNNLEKSKREYYMRQFFGKLRDQAEILYPHGTNLWEQVHHDSGKRLPVQGWIPGRREGL